MDLYSCKVNLNSKADTQVFIPETTAAEIMILRSIHNDPASEEVGGAAPVVEIKKIGEVDRSDEDEKRRLTDTGENGLGIPRYREAVYRKVFPNDYIELPQRLKEFDTKPAAKKKAKDEAAEVSDMLA